MRNSFWRGVLTLVISIPLALYLLNGRSTSIAVNFVAGWGVADIVGEILKSVSVALSLE